MGRAGKKVRTRFNEKGGHLGKPSASISSFFRRVSRRALSDFALFIKQDFAYTTLGTKASVYEIAQGSDLLKQGATTVHNGWTL